MPRDFVYAPTARRRFGVPALGFVLAVPENVTIVAGGAAPFHAREQRADRLVGELELTIVNAAMIMDREGILEELAQQAAAELSLSPRQAAVERASLLQLAGGDAYRVDLRLSCDEAGRRPPPLPYLSTIAIGHPDLMVAAALFAVVRAAHDPWPAGEAMLASLRFK